MSKTAHINRFLALPLLLLIAGGSLFGWHMLTDTFWNNHTQESSQKLQTDAQIAYNNAVVDFTDEYSGAYSLTNFTYFLEGTTQIAPIFCVADSKTVKTQPILDRVNAAIWEEDWWWIPDRLGGSFEMRDQVRAVLTEGGKDGILTLERVYYDAERLSQIISLIPPKTREEIFACTFLYSDWSQPRKK